MEDDAPQPRPSGIRPPSGPPTVTTVGFSPEPDDRYRFDIQSIQDRADSNVRSIEETIAQAREREIDETRLRSALDWVSTEAASFARLTSELNYFMGIRSSVVEQMELEQMVQRPPREGRLPGSEANNMVEVHQKALESVDKMIEVLKATIAAMPPSRREPEVDAGD